MKVEREAKKWSQDRLAEEVTRRGYKIGQSGVGNIESGRTKDPKCIVQLALALDVNAPWLQFRRGPKSGSGTASSRRRGSDEEPKTPIAHYVGAGDEVYLFDDAGTESRIDDAPAPPGFEGQSGAAAIVRGDSMRPVFEPEDVLYFRSLRPAPSLKDVPIRPVIVQIKGGRLFVKKLLPGTKRGAFHLLSVNPLTAPMQDQIVETYAHIEWVKPRLN